jgi:mRNA-capping enzyme
MDLNASPLPEDDDQTYEEPIDLDFGQDEDHIESAVEIMRREREERRRKLKRDQPDDGPRPRPQQIRNDNIAQRQIGGYKRVKETPQGWLDCPASSLPIDKIIPSKVPLDETYNESVPPGKRYSSKQVVNKQRKAGREVSTVLSFFTCV